MAFKKITVGFVVQHFNDRGQCTFQEFICEDICEYENEKGENIDNPENEIYQSYGMVQPSTQSTSKHLRIKPLLIGGVLRCCSSTLESTPVEEKEGEILSCKYCEKSLIFKNGNWQSNSPKQ